MTFGRVTKPPETPKSRITYGVRQACGTHIDLRRFAGMATEKGP
jgi:hypothetical protein